MEEGFYKERLEEYHGLDVLVPEEEDRAEVHRVIYEELIAGNVQDASREAYRDIITRLVERGAEGVILGCTEIPLIINDENSPLPVLDSTRLLARAAVREAKNDQPVTSSSGWLGRAS